MRLLRKGGDVGIAAVVCFVLLGMAIVATSCSRSPRLSELEDKVATLEAEVATLEAELERANANCRMLVEQAYEDCRILVKSAEKRLAMYEGMPLYSYAIHKSSFTSAAGNGVVKLDLHVVPGKTGSLSDTEMIDIAKRVVDSFVEENAVNAIRLYFWAAEDSYERGEEYRGCICWAPNGNWGEADLVRTGDYSTHSFRLISNRTDRPIALRPWPKAVLLESTKKEIFYNLVKEQDKTSLWDPELNEKNQKAKEDIAREYGITMGQLNEIIHEGVMEKWPTPKPPP